MSPSLRLYQIDAFTGEVFKGNPAAVVPLEDWPEDTLLQAIAAENNLSETAFFVPEGEGFRLRWFTPRCEVKLCGHATLASAFVLLTELFPERQEVIFHTRSGELSVRREGALLSMDFPALPLEPADTPPELLLDGLGAAPEQVFTAAANANYYALFDEEEQVATLEPDLKKLAALHPHGVVATAPGSASDCASRYFAPSYGIPEDPVTGSIHCALVPFWAGRLGRSTIHARQLSERGGELFCKNSGERVILSGHAAKYLEGTIHL